MAEEEKTTPLPRPHVVIHLDVNGTILACDPVSGMGVSGVANLSVSSLVHLLVRSSDSDGTATAPPLRFLRLFNGPADHSVGGSLVSAYKFAEAQQKSREAFKAEIARYCESHDGREFQPVCDAIIRAVGGKQVPAQ
jgi:hypothetical protein